MTIEEKAKAYDEVIEKFAVILNLNTVKESGTIFADDVRKILPELNEDERIREVLIGYFKKYKVQEACGVKTFYGIPTNNILAWLEKQGDTNETINRDEFARGVLMGAATHLITWIDYNSAEGNMCLSNMECEDIENALVSGDWDRIYTYIKKKLEKHGEQKPNFCHHEVDLSGCSEEYCKGYYDGWNNCNMQHSQCNSESNDVIKCLINGMKFYYDDNEEATWGTEKFSMKVKDILSWLEKQYKQKSTDKVEPKFKIGDFIVNDYCMGRIVEITNDAYLLDTEQGIPFSSYSARLWDITKDAKNGDVLVHNGCTFIFMGIKDGIVQAIEENMLKLVPFGEPDKDNDYHPATKEQRDKLEKVIADAGYTFDFKKKELKKIVTPIFHIGDKVRYKNHKCSGTITEITDTEYICGYAKLPISTQDKLELVEQKPIIIIPKFREGDEIKTANEKSLTITKIDEKGYWSEDLFICDFDEECLWELVPQKPAWSEEDEKNLQGIIDEIEANKNNAPDYDLATYDRFLSWLKSIKDRYTWKPSDEQIAALKWAINSVPYVYYTEELEGLLDQLKKLIKL